MLTLADGTTRVDVSLVEPPGWKSAGDVVEIPLSWFEEAIDTCGQINKPDYRLSPTGSDTNPDQPLCQEGNATTFGASNYEGTITILRQLDPITRRPDPLKDTLFTAVGEKGTRAYYAERTGPKALQAPAVGDVGLAYEAISDNPQSPSNVNEGYVKRILPLGVQTVRPYIIVADDVDPGEGEGEGESE